MNHFQLSEILNIVVDLWDRISVKNFVVKSQKNCWEQMTEDKYFSHVNTSHTLI